MTPEAAGLVTSSAGAALLTGLFHTLIPDHWLPFALIGRARGWSGRRTASVAFVSALLHVSLSIVLALAALGASRRVAGWWGHNLEAAGGWLLIAFGGIYALWSWRKGGHFHPGGDWLHDDGEASCSGDEGPAHPEHLHYHADETWIRKRSAVGAWTLALIVGANPCVLLMPIVIDVEGRGTAALTAVLVAYALPTVALMCGLSAWTAVRLRAIRLPAGVRYMEPISGLLIAAVGAASLAVHVLGG